MKTGPSLSVPPSPLFPALDAPLRQSLDSLPALIRKTFPLPERFAAGLSADVRELSRLLTSDRAVRDRDYLNKPPLLSAYLRYFLPWNVYRLCRLIPALNLPLENGAAITDLGSGPLTMVLALWISRPDLRKLNLEFRCLDRSAPALEAGKKLFHALAGTAAPWAVKTIHAPIGSAVKGTKAALVSAVNVFNEIFWDISPGDRNGLERMAGRTAGNLMSLRGEGGAVLVVEPGIPRSAAFISLLRSALAGSTGSAGLRLCSPCPHSGPCPLPGGQAAGGKGKAKWCHFAFGTEDAPPDLQKLSAAASLPKERAVLSFLLAASGTDRGAGDTSEIKGEILPVRIISDVFPVGNTPFPVGDAPFPIGNAPGGYGRYGCSSKGLVLVCSDRKTMELCVSGALIPAPFHKARRDAKSGALRIELERSHFSLG